MKSDFSAIIDAYELFQLYSDRSLINKRSFLVHNFLRHGQLKGTLNSQPINYLNLQTEDFLPCIFP